MFIYGRTLWLCIALLGMTVIPPMPHPPIVLVPQPHLWVPEGSVSAIVRQGNTLYLGGSFEHVGPLTGGFATLDTTDDRVIHRATQITGTVWTSLADGAGGWYIGGRFSLGYAGRSLSNLAHILANGQPDYGWVVQVNGPVQVIAISAGMIYVGGEFTSINGSQRRNLAAINRATATVTTWQPDPDGGVYALALDDQHIYAGGYFGSVYGQPRHYLAAFDQATGDLRNWSADIVGQGWVVSLLVDAGILYVGGEFSSIQGQSRHNLASVDINSGLVRDWHPDPDWGVWTLAVSGSDLYVGGNFTTIAGQSRNHLAALDRVSGAIRGWHPQLGDGSVLGLAITGDTVYVGGDLGLVNGQPLGHLIVLDRVTGAQRSWNPNPNGSVRTINISNSTMLIGGSFSLALRWPRSHLAALDLTTGMPTAWAPDLTSASNVQALAVVGQMLYVAGTFAMINGQPRTNLAAFDLPAATLNSWHPVVNGSVHAIAAASSMIYIGGLFEQNGQIQATLARVDPQSAAVTLWPQGICAEVTTLALSGQTLYAGGRDNPTVTGGCTDTTGQAHPWLGAFDVRDGSLLPWPAHSNGDVQALLVHEGIVYAGGSFDTINTQSRFHLAALDPTTAALLAWQLKPDIPSIGSIQVTALAITGSLIYVAYDTSILDASTLVVSDISQAELQGTITSIYGRINTMMLDDGLLGIGNSFGTTPDELAHSSLEVWREPAYTIFMPTELSRFPAN